MDYQAEIDEVQVVLDAARFRQRVMTRRAEELKELLDAKTLDAYLVLELAAEVMGWIYRCAMALRRVKLWHDNDDELVQAVIWFRGKVEHYGFLDAPLPVRTDARVVVGGEASNTHRWPTVPGAKETKKEFGSVYYHRHLEGELLRPALFRAIAIVDGKMTNLISDREHQLAELMEKQRLQSAGLA